MDKETIIKRGLTQFLKNHHWKRFYDGAPTDLCKKYIALDFGQSVCTSKEEDAETLIVKDMDLLEKSLSDEDIKYLIDNAQNGYERNRLEKILDMRNS